MEKLTQDQLIEGLGQLTIPELVALTKSLESTWGVTATPQVTQRGNDPEPNKQETQMEFDLWLQPVSADKKMVVIKFVREYLGLPLKEAKDFVEGAPKLIKDGLSKEDLDDAKTKFEAAGAVVEVK